MQFEVLVSRENCSASRNFLPHGNPLFLRGHAKVAIPFSPPLALAQRIVLFPIKKASIFSFHRKLETYLETFAFSRTGKCFSAVLFNELSIQASSLAITAAFQELSVPLTPSYLCTWQMHTVKQYIAN